MLKNLLLFCLLAHVSLVLSDPVTFKDCGSKQATIASVDVSGCPKLPCQLKKGTNVTVTVNFTPNQDITAATTVVYGYLNGKIKTPFPLRDKDACHDMTCPAKSGQATTYKHYLYVNPLYPTIPVIVQWEVHQGNDVVWCFSVPVVIVS